MSRNILLIEPNYRNKYPPMSLMKIASYYKRLGDNVKFFKGNLIDLVLEDTYELLLNQLHYANENVFWEQFKPVLCNFIKTGRKSLVEDIPEIEEDPVVLELLTYYRQYFYRKNYLLPEYRKYDIICITTLFTFYWDITIETINFAKQLCKDESNVHVGGIMASILASRIKDATGIMPHIGALDKPGSLGDDNDIIIDTLPLDYSILEEIEYEYPASNAYYAYTSRGCVNKCAFCIVPLLEPNYKNFLPVAKQIKADEEHFGAKRDLLLLDNNVLASKCFDKIIDEIKAAGFYKGARYQPPNEFEIAIQNLKSGLNDAGYIRKCVKEYRKLIQRNNLPNLQAVYNLLMDKHLLEFYSATKENILDTYEDVKPLFEKMYRPTRVGRQRYVDFNQGIDARLITNENMAKMAEIPIRPVRIAFDHWKLKDVYIKAVKTAVHNGHTNLSNYILYNFKDTPLELYWRLKVNVELCEDLGATIYSFPMKYHPISDPEYFSNRDYIGEHWNRKFIRTIQAILNATKGKIGRGKSFFDKAFGANEDEFYKLLYMPESMIIYRFACEEAGLTEKWWNAFQSLNDNEMAIAKKIIETNDFDKVEEETDNSNVLEVLSYYKLNKNIIAEAIKQQNLNKLK